MAKSLRSKWKRKMRAIKRVRYGAKELIKLKEVVATSKQIRKEAAAAAVHSPVEMTVLDVSSSKNDDENNVEEMQVDKTVRKFKKNLQDQFGNYPIWMNPRHVKKQKKKNPKRNNARTKGKIVKKNNGNKKAKH